MLPGGPSGPGSPAGPGGPCGPGGPVSPGASSSIISMISSKSTGAEPGLTERNSILVVATLSASYNI